MTRPTRRPTSLRLNDGENNVGCQRHFPYYVVASNYRFFVTEADAILILEQYMFDNFDPSLLDDPEFKEDSVREEIIVPILKRLGYTMSGPNKIVRSKVLLHPFVMIGSKKHPVNIVPDYLLYSEGRPALVSDAKRPDAELIKSRHAEQAYSYAIHPEVRVRYYALCNGRKLVAYDIYGIAPIFEIDFADIERDWDMIESVLSPENVALMPERYFDPDFGIAVVKMGFPSGCSWVFPLVKLSSFICIDTNLFTMSITVSVDDVRSHGIIRHRKWNIYENSRVDRRKQSQSPSEVAGSWPTGPFKAAHIRFTQYRSRESYTRAA